MPLARVEITLTIVLEVHGLNNHRNETNITYCSFEFRDYRFRPEPQVLKKI